MTGKHNPYQTTFRRVLWQAQDTSQDALSEGTVSNIILQKNSSSKKLNVSLPWQVYEVCNRLKDCVLTYNIPQSKTVNAPSLQFAYDTLTVPGRQASKMADWYTWSQHNFTYKSSSNQTSAIDSAEHTNWPLGVYDSTEADKVIADEYDKLSKLQDASAYAPKQITFGGTFSKANWKTDKVIVQKCKRGTVSAGEDDGMRTLTKAADINTLLKKLEKCSLTQTSSGDNSDYHYSLYFKVNGGWFSWDDAICTTHLGLKLKEGLPVGQYVSPQAQKVIDGYYTK